MSAKARCFLNPPWQRHPDLFSCAFLGVGSFSLRSGGNIRAQVTSVPASGSFFERRLAGARRCPTMRPGQLSVLRSEVCRAAASHSQTQKFAVRVCDFFEAYDLTVRPSNSPNVATRVASGSLLFGFRSDIALQPNQHDQVQTLL